MSLKEVSLQSITFKQYIYKLKGYSNLFFALLIAQILSLVFSLQGTMHSGHGNGELNVSVIGYTGDQVIIFSCLLIMGTAFSIANRSYKNTEFSLIANRLSSNLSDIGFLMTCSLFSGITASLCGVLLRVIGYFTFDRTQILLEGFFIDPADLLLGIFVTSLYLLFLSSFTYLGGTLIERNKIFAIIIPVVLFGVRDFLGEIYTNVFESTFILHVLKILILTIILFGASTLIYKGMEVRK